MGILVWEKLVQLQIGHTVKNAEFNFAQKDRLARVGDQMRYRVDDGASGLFRSEIRA